jgi:hypothetical protein
MVQSTKVDDSDQAFCKKTKVLLCINCILEDKNKQHELMSLDEGFSAESSHLKQLEDRIKTELANIDSAVVGIEVHTKAIATKLEEKQEQVLDFFRLFRALLDRKEDEHLQFYKHQAEVELKKTYEYKNTVEYKKVSLLEYLDLVKDVNLIQDKYIVLSQSKKVIDAVEEGFKPFKHERFTFSFKEFRPEVELKNISADMIEESRDNRMKLARIKKSVPEVPVLKQSETTCNLKVHESLQRNDGFKEVSSSAIFGVLTKSQSQLQPTTSNPPLLKSQVTPAPSNPLSKSTVRDRSRNFDTSRDKSKPSTPQLGAQKKFKKENVPPRQQVSAQQTTAQSTSLTQPSTNLQSKNSSKNVKAPTKIEESKTKNVAKTSIYDEALKRLGDLPCTIKDLEIERDSSISPSPLHQSHTNLPSTFAMRDSIPVTALPGLSAANPIGVKRTSDLEKARALKKAAASKLQAHGNASERVSTPTKGKETTLERSPSKSLNKKLIVEVDETELSENQGLRMTTFKMNTLGMTHTPSVLIVGGYGSDPETELPLTRYEYGKSTWSTLGGRSCLVKAACVKVSANKVWAIGGKQRGKRLDTVAEIDILSGETKTLDMVLSRPKSGCGAVLVDNLIYVIGGNSGESILAEMDIIDINTKEVKKGPQMTSRRDEMGVILGDDGNIFAFGGYGGNTHDYLSSCEKFNPQKGKWEPAAALKKPRRSLCCVCMPDGIYCIGGFDGKNYLKTVEK